MCTMHFVELNKVIIIISNRLYYNEELEMACQQSIHLCCAQAKKIR